MTMQTITDRKDIVRENLGEHSKELTESLAYHFRESVATVDFKAIHV